jgi:hypothetical protein
MKRSLIAGVLFTLSALQLAVNGQTVDWFTGGNTSLDPATSFLGTTDGVPINLRTNNLLRARLNNTTSYVISNPFFGLQVSDGYLGLSPNNTLWTSAPGPFSRLHLHDGLTGVLQSGYRTWMRNGVTFTGNRDHGYMGQRYYDEDQTDMVIQWSDKQRLRRPRSETAVG